MSILLNYSSHCKQSISDFDTILCSDTKSQIMPFSPECFLSHYGGQLKTAVEKEAGEKMDCKR